MAYTLRRLAAGSYDLVLGDNLVGSVVRNVLPGGGYSGWRAELLDDRSDANRPEPFTAAEHEFASLAEVTDWLGSPIILDEPNNG